MGSVACEGAGCEAGVRMRVKAAWNKWNEMAGIMYDKRMPVELKVKVYIYNCLSCETSHVIWQ